MKSRREFLEFLGRGSVALGTLPFLNACESASLALNPEPFRALVPTRIDALTLVDGLKYDIIARWDDPIRDGLKFGTNNDYTCFFPANEEGTEGILWVNHESISPVLISGRTKEKPPRKE